MGIAITLRTTSVLMISWPGRCKSICSRTSIGSSVRRNVDGDIARLEFVEVETAGPRSEVSGVVISDKSADSSKPDRSNLSCSSNLPLPKNDLATLTNGKQLKPKNKVKRRHSFKPTLWLLQNCCKETRTPPRSLPFVFAPLRAYCPSKVHQYPHLERLPTSTIWLCTTDHCQQPNLRSAVQIQKKKAWSLDPENTPICRSPPSHR